MSTRSLLFSIKPSDSSIETQHFSAGGPGGQNVNRRSTATRYIHLPSGARGESREHRTQHANDKAAWRRMCEHPAFRLWVHLEVRRLEGEQSAETKVDQMLADKSQIRIEVRNTEGQWVEVPESALTDTNVHVTGRGVTVHGNR